MPNLVGEGQNAETAKESLSELSCVNRAVGKAQLRQDQPKRVCHLYSHLPHAIALQVTRAPIIATKASLILVVPVFRSAHSRGQDGSGPKRQRRRNVPKAKRQPIELAAFISVPTPYETYLCGI